MCGAPTEGSAGRHQSGPGAAPTSGGCPGTAGGTVIRRRGLPRCGRGSGACIGRRRHLRGDGIRTADLTRIDDTRRRRWRSGGVGVVVGKRRVQRRRRNALGRFGSADHDPVSRRILHEVCGVARRDHAEFARGLGQRGCGLRLEHVALERFLLLQQRLIRLTGVAQLIRPLRGVGGQPQRDAQPDPERADHQHHERHPGHQRPRIEVDRGQLDDDPLAQWRPDDLGRLGFPRLGARLGLAGVLRPARRDRSDVGWGSSGVPTVAAAVRGPACGVRCTSPARRAPPRAVRRRSSVPRTAFPRLACLACLARWVFIRQPPSFPVLVAARTRYAG